LLVHAAHVTSCDVHATLVHVTRMAYLPYGNAEVVSVVPSGAMSVASVAYVPVVDCRMAM
jgi:hypothetical protein